MEEQIPKGNSGYISERMKGLGLGWGVKGGL